MFPSKGWYKIITKPRSFRGPYAVQPTFGTPNWIWRPRIEPVHSVVFWSKKEVAPVDAQNAAAFLLGWKKD